MEINDVINKSIQSTNDRLGGNGNYNLVIAMEELSELGQQISKVLRGKSNKDHLIEEIADVTIALQYIKQICNISETELNKAMQYKIKRLDDTINSQGIYQ